jgi:organic radical activating enzyme
VIENKFVMKRCGIIITYRCNLKCKLCTAYSPYYDIPPHFEYEDLAKSIDKYFDLVSYVGKFTISGGEPMVHKDLVKIISHTLKYKNQFDFIEIISNGTVVPNSDLMNIIKDNKDKIKFLIDDYGKNLSTKIKDIQELFETNNIRHDIRGNNIEDAHCNGWIDFGDFSQKLFSQDEIEKLFSKCALPQKMNFCFTIKKGEIHPCGPSYRCMELSIIQKNKDEYVDLFDESETKEDKQRKIFNIQNTKSLSACAYCNGMCEDSPRFPPAEQL